MKTIESTLACLLLVLFTITYAKAQTENPSVTEPNADRRFSLSTPYLSLINFEDEKTNTHHYELQFGYKLSSNTRIGVKLATWKLFAPMGMPIAEQLKFDEANYYPGRLKEIGIGITYQRMLWKGLFASIEAMPQFKTYVDENNSKICNGFKLYTSYHIGYRVTLFKNRFFLEPQIHCNYWPIDTNTPESYKQMDNKWNNYILFEPNLYLGVNF